MYCDGDDGDDGAGGVCAPSGSAPSKVSTSHDQRVVLMRRRRATRMARLESAIRGLTNLKLHGTPLRASDSGVRASRALRGSRRGRRCAGEGIPTDEFVTSPVLE